MSRKRKGGGMKTLIIVLVLALAVVAALIAWKQWEYRASEDFYDGLRGVLRCGGVEI